MLSRSQLLNGPLLQDYLWTKYFILIKSVNLCAQKKPEKSLILLSIESAHDLINPKLRKWKIKY